MSHGIGVAAGMNSQFLFGLIFYLTTLGIGIYFAIFYDFDPFDQILHTVIGAIMGSSATVLGITSVVKIIKKEKEIVK